MLTKVFQIVYDSNCRLGDVPGGGECLLGNMPPWENATWENAVVECAGGKVPGAKCPNTYKFRGGV